MGVSNKSFAILLVLCVVLSFTLGAPMYEVIYDVEPLAEYEPSTIQYTNPETISLKEISQYFYKMELYDSIQFTKILDDSELGEIKILKLIEAPTSYRILTAEEKSYIVNTYQNTAFSKYLYFGDTPEQNLFKLTALVVAPCVRENGNDTVTHVQSYKDFLKNILDHNSDHTVHEDFFPFLNATISTLDNIVGCGRKELQNNVKNATLVLNRMLNHTNATANEEASLELQNYHGNISKVFQEYNQSNTPELASLIMKNHTLYREYLISDAYKRDNGILQTIYESAVYTNDNETMSVNKYLLNALVICYQLKSIENSRLDARSVEITELSYNTLYELTRKLIANPVEDVIAAIKAVRLRCSQNVTDLTLDIHVASDCYQLRDLELVMYKTLEAIDLKDTDLKGEELKILVFMHDYIVKIMRDT